MENKNAPVMLKSEKEIQLPSEDTHVTGTIS